MNKNYLLILIIWLQFLPAKAQIFPYIQDFEGYASFSPPNDWITSTAPFNIYPTHGVGNSKALTRQFFGLSNHDSIISPLIGPVSSLTQLLFDYRIVDYIGSTALAHNIEPGDKIEISILDGVNPPFSALLIDMSNHNNSSSFAASGFDLSGFLGDTIRIMISVTSGGGDFFVDIDNFNVTDFIGINENGMENFLSLYPNPVSNTLNISTTKNGILKIYNSLGEIVKEMRINDLINAVDVSDLSMGNYTVKLFYGNQLTIVKSFTKN